MIALIVVVLIAAAAAAFLLLADNKDSKDGTASDEVPVSSGTPEFDFEVRKIEAVTTETGDKPDKTTDQQIADAVSAELSTFYKAAYLDPDNWSQGRYDSAFEFFDEDALPDAKAQADSLTLGDGSSYEEVVPKPSTTSVTILLGPDGKPLTVNARVTFGVLTTDDTGAQTTVASMGQYFLKPQGKHWTIYAWKIEQTTQQGDQVVGKPSPEPKAKKESPSPEVSP